jgi:hypothetical protein
MSSPLMTHEMACQSRNDEKNPTQNRNLYRLPEFLENDNRVPVNIELVMSEYFKPFSALDSSKELAIMAVMLKNGGIIKILSL